jgi:mannose-6-phosphate isomerase
LKRAIQEVRAEELLNWVDIYPGEMIYVDAGTVHTIGPGSILVETQQNSDTTYRLYDYGRPREIHVEQGLAAVKERTAAGKVKRDAGSSGALISSACFVVAKVRLESGEILDSFHGGEKKASMAILVGLDGIAVVECDGVSTTLRPGGAVVMPPNLPQAHVRGCSAEFLVATLPSKSGGGF